MKHETFTPSTGWNAINSEEDSEIFLSWIRGFHDAVTRLAELDSGSYINQDFEMIEEREPSLWILVQTQWEDTPCVELWFSGVEKIELNARSDRNGELRLLNKKSVMHFGIWKVQFKRLSYRVKSPDDLDGSCSAFGRLEDFFCKSSAK